MSPLILVGLLAITTLNPAFADVKHVLEGSAHPPCKCAENHHHYQDQHEHQHQHHYQYNDGSSTSGSFSGNFGGAPNVPGAPNNVVPGSVSFWWADSNSPFKHAYEYFKKCSEKGNCFPPVSPGIQVTNTIQHEGASGSIDVQHKGTSGPTPSPFGPIDVNKNPYLNGQIQGVAGAGVTTSQSGGGQINLSGNPFLNGQSAYSGDGETVTTGSDGFLGVQPAVPFGKNQPKPFPTSHPNGVNQQAFPTAHPHGNAGVNQGYHPFPTAVPTRQQSFPTGHPNQDKKFESCKIPGHICVASELCSNGLVNTRGQGLLQARNKVEYCEIGRETCCLLPEGEGTSYHPTQSRGSFSTGFTASSSLSASSSFGTTPPQLPGYSNLSHITAGKSSVPGSTIKFSGTAGLSPGLIQVLPVGEEVPNPYISSAGESGSGVAHRGSSSTSKVIRDTTPNPNSVFSSTVDYSNDKLDQLSFVSTIRGPQYLPPVSTPVPSVHTPDLEAPHPPISTYQPSIPTTSRPFVTKPVIPGASVVSVYTPTQKPFVPSFGSSSSFSITQKPFNSFSYSTTQKPFIFSSTYAPTPKPFVPSSPKPFVTNDYSRQPQNTFPSYTASNQYLPPHQPSSPKPFTTPTPQASYTQPAVIYTRPQVTQKPTFQTSYLPPQTPAKPYIPPSTPKPYVPPTFKPYSPPTYKPYSPPSYKPSPQPTQPSPQVTGGYSYPTPTPAFEYPKPTQKPFIPQSSSNIGNNYIPPSTPKPYVPPTFKPYSPSTYKPYKPQPTQPSPQVTGGYSYPTPTPAFEYPKPTQKPFIPQGSSNIGNNYVPPKQPQVTGGYSYPTPTPAFEYPKPTQKPFIPQGSSNVGNNYIPPKQPQVTGGYSYPTPTPAFEYPKSTPKPITPSPSITFTNKYIPPSPSTNKYIPPQPTPGYQYPTPSPAFEYPKPSTPKPDYSFNNNYVTPKPVTPRPTYSTPKPYSPITQSTPGYHYPTPTPIFPYPSPSPSVPQPTRRPANNQYLPPRDENPNESINQNYKVPYPTTKAPAYIPPRPDETGQPNIPQISIVNPDVPPQHAGCAAALKCVQEIYCTADGFISSVPVTLSKEQEYLRVPTTECFDQDSGAIGKCCRDPNYVDPWPSANLINGIDNGQYREDPTLGQYFPQKQRPARSETSSNVKNSLASSDVKVPQQNQFSAPLPARIPEPFNTPAVVAAASNNDKTCGIRNPNIEPHGLGALDAGFAEIPWQAMILRDTNRSLLCGGVIVKPNAVLTAAHCVEGLATGDILIKAGEWKLGIDEEPLPFQIVKVSAIIRHPLYQPGLYLNDLALLMLEERLRVADNVGSICLPPNNQPPPPQTQCIVTGWGKHILQVHLRDAIMRLVDVNILDNNQCSEQLNNKYQHVLQHYSPQDTICAYSSNDQCKVDYGSALACTNGDGQYTLAGIFSWDTGCKDKTQIGGYTPPDVEWIESTCSKPLTHLKALDRQYRDQYRNQK